MAGLGDLVGGRRRSLPKRRTAASAIMQQIFHKIDIVPWSIAQSVEELAFTTTRSEILRSWPQYGVGYSRHPNNAIAS